MGGVNGSNGNASNGNAAGRPPRCLWQEWERLEPRLATPEPMLVCLDYDGTLTPIRERPEEVETPPEVAAALAELAARPATRVAVVSGRRLEELEERLPDGLWLVGCHGLEVRDPDGCRDRGWTGTGATVSAISIPALRRLAERFERCVPGLRLEDKGSALALHTRGVAGEHGRDAARVFASAAAGCRGVRVIEGKEVVEVVPEEASKGRAVARLRERLAPGGPVLFAGDDTTDEDAFEELDGSDAVTVLVGDERPTRAHYRISGPSGVAELLRRLARLRRDDSRFDQQIA